MRIAFVIIWTFGICFGFGYYYVTKYHRQPDISLNTIIALFAWLSGMAIVYYWHKSKKDSDKNNDTPSSWL